LYVIPTKGSNKIYGTGFRTGRGPYAQRLRRRQRVGTFPHPTLSTRRQAGTARAPNRDPC